jgi:hypothetical protein
VVAAEVPPGVPQGTSRGTSGYLQGYLRVPPGVPEGTPRGISGHPPRHLRVLLGVPQATSPSTSGWRSARCTRRRRRARARYASSRTPQAGSFATARSCACAAPVCQRWTAPAHPKTPHAHRKATHGTRPAHGSCPPCRFGRNPVTPTHRRMSCGTTARDLHRTLKNSLPVRQARCQITGTPARAEALGSRAAWRVAGHGRSTAEGDAS